MLEVFKFLLRFVCPLELVSFTEKLVEGQCLFAHSTDESTECRNSSGQLLDTSYVLRLLHGQYGFYFLRVRLDPSRGDKIPE